MRVNLDTAIYYNRTDWLSDLLGSGISPNQCSEEMEGFNGKMTPLMKAAGYPRIEPMKLLLESGADVNALDGNRWTALMCAMNRTSQTEKPDDVLQIVRLLLEYGADVNATTSVGWTPFMFATQQQMGDVVAELTSAGASTKGSKLAELAHACDAHDADRAKTAILNGADTDAYLEPLGWTPVCYACIAGDSDLLKTLLHSGADVNKRSLGGFTPLIRASSIEEFNFTLSSIEIIELLLKYGADVNAKDSNGLTALSYAEEEGIEEVIEVLKENGAKKGKPISENTSDTMPISTIYYLISSANSDISPENAKKVLGEWLSNAPAEDLLGKGLLYAASYEDPDVVISFLKAGADPNYMSVLGETSLKNAAVNGNAKIAQALLAAGVDNKNEDSALALRWAINEDNQNAVEVIRKDKHGIL